MKDLCYVSKKINEKIKLYQFLKIKTKLKFKNIERLI